MKRESPRKSREPSQVSSFALPPPSGTSTSYSGTALPAPHSPAGSPSAARGTSVSGVNTSTSGSNNTAGNARPGEVNAVPMLSSPLMLQATALRRPEMYEQQVRPECVEEGDILYDVLRNPLVHTPYTADNTHNNAVAKASAAAMQPPAVHTQPFGVRPALCLPTKIGTYVAHEVFRALLCFYNSAPYALHELDMRIEYSQSKEARLPLLNATLTLLEPQAVYATVVEMPLRASGMCTLHVRALCKDPSQEGRRLLWATSVQVEDGLTELTRQLRRVYCSRKLTQPTLVPSAKFTTSASTNSPTGQQLQQAEEDRQAAAAVLLPETRYVLSIELCNTARAPLMLTSTELVLAGGAATTNGSGESGYGSPTQVSRVATTSSSSSFAASSLFTLVQSARIKVPSSAEQSPSDNTENDSASGHTLLEPGDVMMLKYELRMESEVLRNAMRHTKVQAHSAHGVSAMILPGSLYALGHVRWSWCRANGEVGQGRSAPLQLARLRATSEMDLVILDVRQTMSDGTSYSFVSPHAQTKGDTSDVSDAAALSSLLPLTALRVGQPVELDCVVLYYPQSNTPLPPPPTTTTTASRSGSVAHAPDVALKVRVEHLAPDWLYAGPAVRPLGLLEQGMVSFTITLIPWRAGWCRLAAGLEIVDARALDTVLWPPARVTWLEPWSAVLQGSTSNTTPVGQLASNAAYYPTVSYAVPVSPQVTTNSTKATATSSSSMPREQSSAAAAGVNEVLMPLLKEIGPEGESEENARPVLLQALVL